MNKVKCNNVSQPHFYDADIYDECPHCKKLVGGSGNEKSGNSISFRPEEPNQSSEKIDRRNDRGGNKTFGLFGGRQQRPRGDGANYTGGEASRNQAVSAEKNIVESNAGNARPPQASIPATPERTVNETQKDTSSKTQGFFSIGGTQNNEPITYSKGIVENTEPCAGWLICIKGKYFGCNFPVYAGRNSIGRNESNKISIAGDMSVSGEKHAWIVYEPKKREFYVQPGESSGLTYLNDNNVLGTEKIVKYDKLEIGKGIYMFIPLCCEEFSWEDYMEAK